MRTAIVVTAKLSMDTIDRLAIKATTDEEVRPYIVTTVLALFKRIKFMPLFGKVSVESVDIIRSKEAAKGGK